MAVSQGMKLESYFRKKFSINESVDILSLMEAAITVAACKHPQQLAKRRSIIIKTLLHLGVEDDDDKDNYDLEDEINKSKTSPTAKKKTTTTCFRPKIDDQKRKQQQVVKKIPERKSNTNNIGETEKKKNINEVISSSTATKKVEEEEKKAMEVKLNASKRKLHESYDRLQADRDKKRIKVLEYVPTTQKSSTSRQKTDATRRHKSVQKRVSAVLEAKGKKTRWRPI